MEKEKAQVKTFSSNLRCFYGGGSGIRTHVGVSPNGFQNWIVPLPGVHGSALCILNFTAKKDKKELKWTVFGKNARKLCEKGKNPKKIQAKN